ncbi:unnamed protein product [Knipowitschia caucasica]
MAEESYAFQLSGIKKPEIKKKIIDGIRKLGGNYIGGSVYQHTSTHVIVPQVLPSEKFLAACAAGKWVVTPQYVMDSVQNGSWLPEELYEVAISTSTTSTFYPVRQWRERVASGKLKGAFQGWQVLLMVQEPARRAMFTRLLKAGQAKVFYFSAPSVAPITHVLAKPITEDATSYDAPCYPVSHIVQHLFGKRYLDLNFNFSEDETERERSIGVVDFSVFEIELKERIIEQNYRPRLCYLELKSYHDSYPQSEATEADFSQIATMIECGLFVEALDSIKSALFPGLLPPAPYLVSLIEYAQQGNATSVFLRMFNQYLHRLLVTNPPWSASKFVKKYFSKVFQCPRCKSGLWPFLESAIRYCLLRDCTCHPLPGPALPTLLHFHRDLLAFILKLFKGELYAITTEVHLQREESENPRESAKGSLILGTFWTVWERSTLLSVAVKQLTQLLVEATLEEDSKGTGKEELIHVAGTLADLLSIVVEFWCQYNFKLNQPLVKKALNDFAEHFAASRTLPPILLAELVSKIISSRLKLALADSVFRRFCYENGSSVGDAPLCLKKIMQQYLPALDILSQSPHKARLSVRRHVMTDTGDGLENPSYEVNENCSEKGNVLKGLKRVNVAGETLLHRACKRNQVETVLHILALPDTDVNVKDHAGWTPLHEACNHGSTACVQALLRHRPAPVVDSQVGGVSPLYDAVLNGHMDIAKLLLEHEGSVILHQKHPSGETALDLVTDAAQREELFNCALTRDNAQRRKSTEVQNLPLLEAGSCLLLHLLISYQQEKELIEFDQSEAGDHSLSQRMLRALQMHSFQTVTSAWKDQQAVRLLEDAMTVMEVGRGDYDGLIPTPIRECKGKNTQFLMEKLAVLKSKGQQLVLQLKKS